MEHAPTLVIILLLAIIIFVIRIGIMIWSRQYSTSQTSIPKYPTAIVFGAGLEKDGTPSKVLRERLQCAAWLYQSGKADRIILSGENRWIYYNEPLAMKKTALELGISEKDILIDHDGCRSLATCLNARDRFDVRNAILVTQAFHLPRALFLARAVGIQAAGVPAAHETHRLDDAIWWQIREIPATIKAVIDILHLRFLQSGQR